MSTKPTVIDTPPPQVRPLLSAVFLYSDKDESYQQRVRYFMNLARQDKTLSGVKYHTLESFHKGRFIRNLSNTDLCICLYSDYFKAWMGDHPGIAERLMEEHQLRRLQVICLMLNDAGIEETPMRSSHIFPYRKPPIQDAYWSVEEDAIRSAYISLRPVCELFRRYKNNVNRSWEKIKDSNDEDDFTGFLELFPYSWYSEKARNIRNELMEQRLWKTAQEEGTAAAYFDYIQRTPLKHHYDEATTFLNTIEENEALIWQDVEAQQRPEYYIYYKGLFPRGKRNEAIDKELGRIFKKPITLSEEEEDPDEFEGLYLIKKTYEALRDSPEEMFSFQAYMRYCLTLRGAASKLSKKLSFKVLEYGLYVFMVVLVELFLLYTTPDLKNWLNDNAIEVLLATGLNLFFLYRATRGYQHLEQDIFTAKEDNELLKRASVLIKASFISGDAGAVQKIAEILRVIEERIKEVNHKSFLTYLSESALEQENRASQQL
jgi:hypothetical protein